MEIGPHVAAGVHRGHTRRVYGDPRPGYVPAYDGVRALAVTAVLAYHGGLSWAGGGFLGVDAFFVLSGYLITTLLLREWQRTGRIAVVAFWGRRARRLLPALLLVLTAVVLGGRLLLPPEELRLLRGDGLAALFYVANWRMIFRGGDYFAQTASPSPLQHMWSLGIEEQFYLLWPLVLVALLAGRRPLRRTVVLCVVGAVGLSVLLALTYRAGDLGRAYYGTDTRAASLLVGAATAGLVVGRPGIVALRRRPLLLGALAAVGATATAWFWTQASGDDSTLYHGGLGVAALSVAVVLGHVALVPEGVSARLLSLPPLPALGRISYGVYLWHWPVFLAANAERTGQEGWRLFALRCLVTLAVATVSYVLVENPIRTGAVLRRSSVATATAASALVGGVALVVAVTAVPALPTQTLDNSLAGPTVGGPVGGSPTDGLDRLPPRRTASERAVASPGGTPSRSPQRRRAGGPVVVDVFGDSVAWSLVAYLPRYRGLDVRDRTALGCGVTRTAPFRYFGRTYPRLFPNCRRWPQRWRRAVASDDPDVALILVGRWETMDRVLDGRWTHIGDPAFDAHLRSRLELAISIAGARGARVVLATEPYNRRGERPDGTLYPEDHPRRVTDWNRLLRDVAADHPGVMVVDLGRRVSPEGRFTWEAGGMQVRSDGLHLTPSGVRDRVAPWLMPRLRAAASH